MVAIAACLGACYIISLKNQERKIRIMGRHDPMSVLGQAGLESYFKVFMMRNPYRMSHLLQSACTSMCPHICDWNTCTQHSNKTREQKIRIICHIAITNCPFRFEFSHLPRCGQLLRQKHRNKLHEIFVQVFLRFSDSSKPGQSLSLIYGLAWLAGIGKSEENLLKINVGLLLWPKLPTYFDDVTTIENNRQVRVNIDAT